MMVLPAMAMGAWWPRAVAWCRRSFPSSDQSDHLTFNERREDQVVRHHGRTERQVVYRGGPFNLSGQEAERFDVTGDFVIDVEPIDLAVVLEAEREIDGHDVDGVPGQRHVGQDPT